MSVTNIHVANDEDIFSHTLAMLEDELALNFPLVSASVFDSVLEDITVSPQSATVSTIDNDTASSISSPRSDSSETVVESPAPSNRALRVSMKAKRYRNRKREELESLRCTVKTLEVRLAALKARPSPAEVSLGPFPRIWEALAMQEAESRQAAERENEALRETTAMHMQLAHKIDQVMHKVLAHVSTQGNF